MFATKNSLNSHFESVTFCRSKWKEKKINNFSLDHVKTVVSNRKMKTEQFTLSWQQMVRKQREGRRRKEKKESDLPGTKLVQAWPTHSGTGTLRVMNTKQLVLIDFVSSLKRITLVAFLSFNLWSSFGKLFILFFKKK